MPGAGFEPATMRSSAPWMEYSANRATRVNFNKIDKDDFILFWTTERKQKTKKERAEKLYNVLKKVLDGKEINVETLREGFHNTTNKKDYVNAARVLLDYLKSRRYMNRWEIQEILEQPFLTCIGSKKERVPGIASEEADKHIIEVLRWIEEKWDEETVLLYKLLVFSGLRLEHAIRVLETFDERHLEFKGRVARYPTEMIATEIKGSFYAFMPAEFARKLRRIKFTIQYYTIENRLNPKKWKPKKEEWQRSWINAKNIRKWFENFCKRHGVELLYRKFFMGHSTRAVIEHYEQMEDLSWNEYEKIVDKFPIPP